MTARGSLLITRLPLGRDASASVLPKSSNPDRIETEWLKHKSSTSEVFLPRDRRTTVAPRLREGTRRVSRMPIPTFLSPRWSNRMTPYNHDVRRVVPSVRDRILPAFVGSECLLQGKVAIKGARSSQLVRHDDVERRSG